MQSDSSCISRSASPWSWIRRDNAFNVVEIDIHGFVAREHPAGDLEHRRFVFFPTWIHQNLNMLKLDAQAGFEPRSTEPEKVVMLAAPSGRRPCETPASCTPKVTESIKLKAAPLVL